MNKGLLSCFFLLVLSNTLVGQFINFQLTIEPELTAEVEQELDFGTLLSGSGIYTIELGDINTGIFSVSTIHSQELFVQLDHDDFLYPVFSDSESLIPLDLEFSYNVGENSMRNSVLIPENFSQIKLENYRKTGDFWQSVYIYVYGSIDVGPIDTGIYESEVILTIFYS